MSLCDRSSEGLADFLEARKEEIARRWEERMRAALSLAGLSQGDVVDSLPEFLSAVADALRGGQAPLDAIAEAHGRQRYRLGLDISAVVREYSVLRTVIVELLQEEDRAIETEALALFMDVLATARAEALRCHATEHERALHASEAKLQDIIDHAPAVISAKDAQGRYLFVNRAFEEQVGASRQSIVGRTDYDCFSQETADTLRATDAQVLAQGRAIEVEEVVVRQDGPHLWRSLKFPLPGQGERPYAVCCISTDITQPRRLQRERDEARERLSRVLSALPSVYWSFDTRGVLSMCEGRALERIGFRSGQLVGQSVFETFQDHGPILEAVQRALRGEAFSVELEYRGIDFEVSFVPERGPDGAVRNVSGLALDITERKVAEHEAARRADFERHLIGIVSHDLRNPLNAISMAARLLIKQGRVDELARQSVERILSSAERAIRMLRDLLDFTQARLRGGIPVEPRPLDLHELTRSVVEEVQVAHPHRRIVLEQVGDGRGEWDGDRLAQLITNLVTNALTYGSEHCAVRVRTQGRPDAVLLSVHNTGTPISPERISQLFQPLERGKETGARGNHSIGLGLFIVKHIAHAHGGRIVVDSSQAQGTTFTVSLPRSPSRPFGPPRS